MNKCTKVGTLLLCKLLVAGPIANAEESRDFERCMQTLEQLDQNAKQIHARILSLCSDSRKRCGETKNQEIGIIAFSDREMNNWVSRYQEAVKQTRLQGENWMVLLDSIEGER